MTNRPRAKMPPSPRPPRQAALPPSASIAHAIAFWKRIVRAVSRVLTHGQVMREFLSTMQDLKNVMR